MTVFPSDFNNIYHKYLGILQNLLRSYEILRTFTKATIFHGVFSVKSLTFVPFRPIMKYYWHFVILYHDKQNSFVCYCTVSPLGNISKYFAIVKWKVIFSISITDTYLEWQTMASKAFKHSKKWKKIFKSSPRSY